MKKIIFIFIIISCFLFQISFAQELKSVDNSNLASLADELAELGGQKPQTISIIDAETREIKYLAPDGGYYSIGTKLNINGKDIIVGQGFIIENNQNGNPIKKQMGFDSNGNITQTIIPNNTQNSTPSQPTPTSENFLESLVKGDTFGDQPLNRLLNQLFYIGLIAAVVLAIVMIVRGGIEYMTIDSAANKDTGKRRVQAALGGLLLAFSAILILNTINPGLTRLDLVFQPLQDINSIEIENDIWGSVNQFEGLNQQEIADILASGKIPTDISPNAQKILAQAIAAVNNMYTGNIDNTKGGKLACAAAVNKIVQLATGQQVGGGLSTAEMYKSLQNNPNYVQVPGGVSNALPGDIIISPTQGNNTGHVGIVSGVGGSGIISNSSEHKKVLQNYNAQSWDNRYGSRKNLPTYIYRPR